MEGDFLLALSLALYGLGIGALILGSRRVRALRHQVAQLAEIRSAVRSTYLLGIGGLVAGFIALIAFIAASDTTSQSTRFDPWGYIGGAISQAILFIVVLSWLVVRRRQVRGSQPLGARGTLVRSDQVDVSGPPGDVLRWARVAARRNGATVTDVDLAVQTVSGTISTLDGPPMRFLIGLVSTEGDVCRMKVTAWPTNDWPVGDQGVGEYFVRGVIAELVAISEDPSVVVTVHQAVRHFLRRVCQEADEGDSLQAMAGNALDLLDRDPALGSQAVLQVVQTIRDHPREDHVRSILDHDATEAVSRLEAEPDSPL